MKEEPEIMVAIDEGIVDELSSYDAEVKKIVENEGIGGLYRSVDSKKLGSAHQIPRYHLMGLDNWQLDIILARLKIPKS